MGSSLVKGIHSSSAEFSRVKFSIDAFIVFADPDLQQRPLKLQREFQERVLFSIPGAYTQKLMLWAGASGSIFSWRITYVQYTLETLYLISPYRRTRLTESVINSIVEVWLLFSRSCTLKDQGLSDYGHKKVYFVSNRQLERDWKILGGSWFIHFIHFRPSLKAFRDPAIQLELDKFSICKIKILYWAECARGKIASQRNHPEKIDMS